VNVEPYRDATLPERFQRWLERLRGALHNEFEQGTWTPTFTFATPGDLAVAYARQEGFYYRVEDYAYVRCICNGTFTQTTAAGESRVSLPFVRYSDIFREAWWAYVRPTTGLPAGDIQYASARPAEQFVFLIGYPSDTIVAPANYAGSAFDVRFSGHYRIVR
jgi:hypothetical protein